MPLQKQKEITGHAGAVYCCASKGNYIYTGSADKYVTRWKIDEGIQDKFAIKFEYSVYCIEIHEQLLFVGLSDGALHVFDLEKKVELKYFTQHKEGIFSITVNLIKNQLYVGDADGNLSIWDLKSFPVAHIIANCACNSLFNSFILFRL